MVTNNFMYSEIHDDPMSEARSIKSHSLISYGHSQVTTHDVKMYIKDIELTLAKENGNLPSFGGQQDIDVINDTRNL